jgi:hypothetical protein
MRTSGYRDGDVVVITGASGGGQRLAQVRRVH